MEVKASDFQLLVETTSDYAIFLLDVEGCIRSWNPGAERIKQYRQSEILGQHFSIFYPAEDIERGWPAHEIKVATEVGRFEDEGWRIRKDGSRFWANIIITKLVDHEGRHRGFSKITRDLTERRQQEQLLRESEERFRLLVESVKDYAIFMLDTEGRVVSWNIGAEKNKGYAAAEIIGRHFSVFYPPEAVEAGLPTRKLGLALARGRFEDEGWRIRKDGSRFWAGVVITPIHDATGRHRGFVKVTRDLTDRQKISELQDEGRRVSAFLAMLGHELRNPLAPIVNAITILESGTDPTMSQTACQIIGRQAKQMARLVDDLLDVGRITSGKIHLDMEPVPLKDVIQHAVESIGPQVRAKQHRVKLELSHADLCVQGDRTRLIQIVSNLLHNAAKFTEREGSITVRLLQRGQGSVEIAVADNGPGIPSGQLKHVFGLFVQGEQDAARSLGGLGLGLSLVQQLVTLHGGEVSAFSSGQPGEGAEFVVRLPLIDHRELVTMPSEPSAEGDDQLIVVADDNIDAALSMQLLLNTKGYRVATAYDGPDAMKLVRELHPPALIMDIGLPTMSGLEVARTLIRQGAAPPLMIAVSGYGSDSDRDASLAAGFSAHLVKPLDFDELGRLLSENVQSRTGGRSAFG